MTGVTILLAAVAYGAFVLIVLAGLAWINDAIDDWDDDDLP